MSDASIGHIGIFWFFRGRILADAVPHTLGEDYGDFVNGNSDHVTVWPVLQRRMKREIPAIAHYEYEQVPRGRVVYRKTDDTFLVYGSKSFIQNPAQRATVLGEFQIPESRAVFKSDEHYGPVPGMIDGD